MSGLPEGVALGSLPLRNNGEDGPCPADVAGRHEYHTEWSDRRGDNVGTCTRCGKRARWDSSD
jgi:hypothetical protein